MPISGTLPFYDVSTCPDLTTTTGRFTGAAAPSSGSASNAASNETLQDFYDYAAGVLNISGVVAVSGVSGTANGQVITSAQLSGLANLQRELAAREADILVGPAAPNATRVAKANAILTAKGEVQFGS